MDSTTIVRVVAGGVFLVAAVGVAIAFIGFLSRLLGRCSPSSRTMEPGMAWLLLIPIFSIIWGFLVVSELAKSLGNEFRLRGIGSAEPEPGKTLGMAMCVSQACAIVPYVNIFAAPVTLILWILYWVKLAGYARMLDQDTVMTRVNNSLQGI